MSEHNCHLFLEGGSGCVHPQQMLCFVHEAGNACFKVDGYAFCRQRLVSALLPVHLL